MSERLVSLAEEMGMVCCEPVAMEPLGGARPLEAVRIEAVSAVCRA